MTSSYNYVTLIGHLSTDTTLKKVGKKSKTTFKLAVERFNGLDKPKEIDQFNIVTWGKLAEICNEFLENGKKVLIDGRIQVTQTGKGDKKRWVTEVIAENLKFLSNTID